MATTGYDQATGGCPSQCFETDDTGSYNATSCNCLHLQPEGCNYGTGESQCLDESSPNFLRFYNLGCQVDGVSQCTVASPCGGLNFGACPFTPEDPQLTAGFYIIAGKGHGDFKDDPYFKIRVESMGSSPKLSLVSTSGSYKRGSNNNGSNNINVSNNYDPSNYLNISNHHNSSNYINVSNNNHSSSNYSASSNHLDISKYY